MEALKSDKYKWLATIVMTMLVFCIPVDGVFTDKVQLFLAITTFVILLVAFELFDVMIPAVLLPTLYCATGLVPVNVAFSAWTGTTVWMILGSLVLAVILDECGLLTRIALWSIRKCGGSLTGTIYGVFITGIIVNFITFCNAYIIIVTLAYGVAKALDPERTKVSAVICMAGLMGGLSTCVFLYNPAYIALAEAVVQTAHPAFNMNWYVPSVYLLPIVPIDFLIIWVMTKIFRTNEVKGSSLEYFDAKYRELGPMSMKEKKCVVILALLMVFLFTTPLHGINPAWGFMIAPYLMFFPGIAVADKGCIKKTNYAILFFLAACISIGGVGNAVNFTEAFIHALSPLMNGVGLLVLFLIMMAAGIVAKLFLSPYAIIAALSLAFAQVGVSMGCPPLVGVLILFIVTDFVFMPHAASAYLVMYGFGGIAMKDVISFGLIKIVLTLILFAALIYPYWKLTGLI